MKKIALGIIGTGWLWILSLWAPPWVSAAGNESEPLESAELRRVFEADPAGAEKTYLGRSITVKGLVVSTGLSVYLTPNVMISDSVKGRPHVICVLPRADAEKLSDYKDGQPVTMTGRAYRWREKGLVLKECRPAG